MDDGKHDILPVAGFAPDHAVMPVTMLRQTDPDMCPAGYQAATMQHRTASVSTEECTAHQNLSRTVDAVEKRRQRPLADQHGRMVRWRRRQKNQPRLRGQDKAVAPGRHKPLSAHPFSTILTAPSDGRQCRSRRSPGCPHRFGGTGFHCVKRTPHLSIPLSWSPHHGR